MCKTSTLAQEEKSEQKKTPAVNVKENGENSKGVTTHSVEQSCSDKTKINAKAGTGLRGRPGIREKKPQCPICCKSFDASKLQVSFLYRIK